MQTPQNKHAPHLGWLRLTTFLVAALAAASAAYWVLKWTAPAPAPSNAAVVFSDADQADPQAVARLLGGGQTGASALPSEPVVNAASRFKLTGVVAERTRRGYALIAIDGQPAKPYRVGNPVNDDWVLQSVSPRSAALAASMEAPVSLTLELPKLVHP